MTSELCSRNSTAPVAESSTLFGPRSGARLRHASEDRHKSTRRAAAAGASRYSTISLPRDACVVRDEMRYSQPSLAAVTMTTSADVGTVVDGLATIKRIRSNETDELKVGVVSATSFCVFI